MKKFIGFLVVLLIGAFCFCACGINDPAMHHSSKKISVVSWNVQTFFDAQNDGCEYSDFLKSDNWDSRMYFQRLERLSQVLIDLDADVYVLQEIENANVLYDVCNQLTQKSWAPNDGWAHTCFYKNEGSSIGCAVISKYPLADFTTHMIDIRNTKTEQPDMRALMQVTVNVDDVKLNLFVNHWKSKSGNSKNSEIWRNFQESLLSGKVSELLNFSDSIGVICGDFNKDIREFDFVGCPNQNENIRLRGIYLNNDDCLVYSPWLDENGDYTSETGSYFYKGEWERIDNIFTFGKIKISGFEACTDSKWTTENGTPYSYKVYTGEGYSDHLPIKAILNF